MKLNKAFLMLILLIPAFAFSQSQKLKVGDQYLKANTDKLGLSQSDLTDLVISDIYTTKHNGVTHIYYQQSRKGINVYNAILNLNITKEDKMIFHNNTFIQDLDQKINTSKNVVNPDEAVVSLAQFLGIMDSEELNVLKSNNGSVTFAQTSYSNDEIHVTPMYFAINDSDVRLVWDVLLDQKGTADVWSSRIDAVTGQVIGHENRTIYCTHVEGGYHNHSKECRTEHDVKTPKSTSASSAMMGNSYRVYPIPSESPIHGNHELVTDPHYPTASPFGWHDIDGVEGNEYSITRGNNVHAYQDENDDFASENDEPTGGSIGGGPELMFDYQHTIEGEPEESLDADIVNLFYANNMIHDITYLAGFDEVSGNYQLNNFGKGGRGDDYVIAHGLDGAGTNNANFTLSSDGNNGNMNMFRWGLPQSKLFSISEPAELSGSYNFGAVGAGWVLDANYVNVDVTAELAQAFDDHPQFSENVCDEVINGEEIDGKIAMIYRGLCEFGDKALNAQNAGAVAVIICNVPGAGNDPSSDGNEPMGMGGGAFGPQVTIPVLSLGFGDCNKIVATLEGGTPVVGRIFPESTGGPSQVSASFDNGIIFHEFGHGISGRLIGGPNQVCLGTDEQMGEGWSDFFSLALTVEPDDLGSDVRGIGNFVQGNSTVGPGIRRFPYSTDMSINPQTFKDIKATTAPHPLGEVWAGMLWDIYWLYVDIYGYDADWSNTESGNFRAVQLVLDGMKMQGCNPGFINGRDGILAAESVNTNGENKCLLWDVFARRGLGYFADGGSVNNRNDGSENFDPLPECQKTLKIYKESVQIVKKDEEVEVQLIVANHKDEMVNAVVSDFIPDGMSYVDGSANMAESIQGGDIFFNLDNFANGAWDTITYRLMYDNTVNSTVIFNNTVDSPDEIGQWERELIEDQTNIFRINSSGIFPTYSGENSWFVQELDEDTQSSIRFNNIDVAGELPVVRFWHRINTEFTRNGGFVEISTDGILWNDAKELFIRNGYECPIQFTTFAIPKLQGFTGRSDENDYVDSYIDLSSFKGQTISLRFRFGSNSGTDNVDNDETFPPDGGWFLDDIDLIDLVKYDTQACITTSDDEACTPNVRLILDPQLSSGNNDNNIEGVSFNIYPNPASDYIALDVFSENVFNANISIWTMEGRQVLNETHNINKRQNLISLNTSSLTPGVYAIQLLSENGLISKKIIIQ
ncbi:MAG: T9SS type A sorting domain-containing protein [Saprospiraceae bacterium]|nr:T9SS type A sorting domain-containing protein [Saprospiraceae bacterium]